MSKDSRTSEAMMAGPDNTSYSGSQEFAKTEFTKAGRPKLGTTISLHLNDGDWEDAKVVAHLEGTGPEGRYGLIGIIVEFPDGARQSLEWPLIPVGANE